MTDEMKQVIYFNKALTMVQDSMFKPTLRVDEETDDDEDYEFCDLCDEEVEADDLTEVEFENDIKLACKACLTDMPEEYPEDEDQFRGDR